MVLPYLAAALIPVWVGGLPPGAPHAIAVLGSRPFVGTEQGLYGSGPVGFEPVFTRGPVRDVAAGPGRLLIATDVGLYEWRERDRILRSQRLGSSPKVHAVAIGPGGTAWAATEEGLFTRPPGELDFRRVPHFLVADVRAVCTAGPEVWVATPGVLWARRDNSSFSPILRGIPEGWWQLVGAVHRNGHTLLAAPSGLWSVEGEEIRQIETGLAPLRALAALGSELWVGTDRGLFAVGLTDGWAGAVEAPAVPTFSGEVLDVTSEGARLWVAARRGLLTLSPSRPPSARAGEPGGFRRSVREQSEVAAMHRAVLAYLGLSPLRLRDLERRSRRAGLWPEVRATLTAGRERARMLERDQTVSGGSLWRLSDSESEEDRDVQFQLQLSWDLARLSGPADALAVSKERREVVELVERILDRVNRAYFERERLLSRLRDLPHERMEERDALSVQARELAATLEGLTGGGFSGSEGTPGPQPKGSP